MAKIPGWKANILVEGYNIASRTNEFSASLGFEELEGTCYTDAAKSYLPGTLEARITAAGIVDPAAGNVHAALKTLAVSAEEVVSLVIPTSATSATPAVGDPALSIDTQRFKYDVTPDLAGYVGWAIEAACRGNDTDWGTVLHWGAETNTGNGSSVDNAASTANGAVASLHVTAATASATITFKVQHSANGTAWVDLITFTLTGVAINGERGTATGTVNRYLRATWTFSLADNCTFAITCARL